MRPYFISRLFILCVFALLPSHVVAEESFTVVATDPAGKQLVPIRVDLKSGKPSIVFSPGSMNFSLPFRPLGIVADQSSRKMIVTSNKASDKGFPSTTVSLDNRGVMTMSQIVHLKYPAGYTSIDRSGNYLLSSNYMTSDVSVYHLGADRQIGELASHTRIPLLYAHCVLTTRDNRFVYIPCVKENNALFQYEFDEETGKLNPLEPLDAGPPAMHGPRHVAYHPSLPIAYFSNEQQLGVSVYKIGDMGQLIDIQHAVTMPRRSPYVKGKRGRHASDVVVTGDGKWLFVAVRDFVNDDDSVFTFRIEDDGRLSQVARTKVGDIPWKLNLSPAEEYLVVSESGDNTIAVLQISKDGSLTVQERRAVGASVRNMAVIGDSK